MRTQGVISSKPTKHATNLFVGLASALKFFTIFGKRSIEPKRGDQNEACQRKESLRTPDC
jgi:hypothetical protein